MGKPSKKGTVRKVAMISQHTRRYHSKTIQELYNMFRIIALKPLEGCAEHILKCLKIDQMYYLCNGFSIGGQGEIAFKENGGWRLSDDFYWVKEKNICKKPIISVSAVVGKNGEGKSTLIELMIRLINNCALRYEMDPQKNLIRIEGVKAELYLQSGNRILRMIETKEMIKPDLQEVAVVANDNSFKNNVRTLNKEEVKEDFFYTLVNNYSHYAYNLTDFVDEKNYGAGGNSEEEKYWLYRVFHKNDGYQSPISLHPYRKWGNIDINREKELSDQRLLSLIMSSSSSLGDGLLMDFNGKQPFMIELTLLESTKLKEKTIKERFEWYKNTNWLGDIADEIRRISTKSNEKEIFKFLKLEIINQFLSLVDIIDKNEDYNGTKREYLRAILKLAKEDKKRYLPLKSDLMEFLTALKRIRKYDGRVDEIITSMQEFSAMNLAQLQWALLIIQVIEFWRNGLEFHGEKVKFQIVPESLTCKEENLTTRYKSQHYIIYKTISIFDTYPEYKKTMAFVRDAPFFQRITKEEAISDELKNGFKILQNDCNEKSHITLKLRQTIRFYVDLCNQKAIWADTDVMEPKLGEEVESLVWNVYIEKLRSKYDKNTFEDQEMMPPRIFTWDIVFRLKNSDDKQPIPYRMFSSGEKQFLQVVGAVMYHLNNIDSIASTETRYRNINLILEEIELYFHPEWQRQWVWNLIIMLRGITYKYIENVNIILVTHSPFVLSDIPKSNVLFLKSGIPNYEMQMNTFGANIHSLLKNGFFLPGLPMGEFAHKKIDNLFGEVNSANKKVVEKYDELLADIMQIGEPVLRSELLSLLSGYSPLRERKK